MRVCVCVCRDSRGGGSFGCVSTVRTVSLSTGAGRTGEWISYYGIVDLGEEWVEGRRQGRKKGKRGDGFGKISGKRVASSQPREGKPRIPEGERGLRPERISLGFIRRVRREDFCETGASGLAKEAEISNDGVFPTLSSSRKSLSLSLSLPLFLFTSSLPPRRFLRSSRNCAHCIFQLSNRHSSFCTLSIDFT